MAQQPTLVVRVELNQAKSKVDKEGVKVKNATYKGGHKFTSVPKWTWLIMMCAEK